MKLRVAPKVSIALTGLAVLALLTQSLVQFWQEYRRALADAVDDGTVFAQLLAEHTRRVYAADGLEAARHDVQTPRGGVDGVRASLMLLSEDALPAEAQAELRAGRNATWRPTRSRLVVAMPVQLGGDAAAVVVQQDLSVREAHLVSVVGLVFGAAACSRSPRSCRRASSVRCWWRGRSPACRRWLSGWAAATRTLA